MKYLDSAFVDKIRSDLRARETQKFYKTDYSLVKSETKSEYSRHSTGVKTELKAIKKEPKSTQKTSQRTKVNWSTSKPKRLAIFFIPSSGSKKPSSGRALQALCQLTDKIKSNR